MDVLEGVELLDFLNGCNENDIDDDEFFRYIFLKVGNAIHQLHKAGIAHRDIKLENIMITKDFEIKLIDFGYSIALAGRNESGFMKSRVGTFMYMAPEVMDKTVTYQGQDADCFAFGVSLLVAKIMDYPWKKPDRYSGKYETLVDENGTKAEKFWAHYSDCELSDEFKGFIESMVAYNPTCRATMADILGHEWMRGKVISKEQFEKKCKEFLNKSIEEQ